MQESTVFEQAEDKQFIKTQVVEWMDERIDHEELAENARGTVSYFRENAELDDDGNYTAWCVTLVSGAHGHYVAASFLHDVLWVDEAWDNVRNLVKESMDMRELFESQGGLLDSVTNEVEKQLNQAKPGNMPGSYYLGYHEADGSFGIYYTESGEN